MAPAPDEMSNAKLADNLRLARRARLERKLKGAGTLSTTIISTGTTTTITTITITSPLPPPLPGAPCKADRGLEAACQHTNGAVAFVRGGASESDQAASNRIKSMRMALRQHHLREACGGVAGVAYAPASTGEESAEDRDMRHAGMLADLRGAGAPEPFEWMRPENGKEARQRLREVAVARRQAQELRTDGLKKFLADELGNLPLSVKLCGHMLRATSGGALGFG